MRIVPIMKKSLAAFLALAIGGTSLSACGGSSGSADIVTTTSVMAAIVRMVVPGDVTVASVVPDGKDRFRRVDVSTGIESGDFVEVTRGLTAGQQVVAQGAFVLKSELLLEKEAE